MIGPPIQKEAALANSVGDLALLKQQQRMGRQQCSRDSELGCHIKKKGPSALQPEKETKMMRREEGENGAIKPGQIELDLEKDEAVKYVL